MKQLSIEEKAKRYDEAIKLAKDSFNYPNYPGFIRADVVFPEIKESEDERIRKGILHLIGCASEIEWCKANVSIGEVQTWLEKQKERNTNTHLPSFDEAQGTPIVKQGEQNPAWSEEDETRLNTICGILKGLPLQQNWLKNLKYRVQPQPKQEWNDQALRAVEIARKEAVEQTVDWLTKHAIKYYINSKGFLGTDELVKDYKLTMSMKHEQKD